jgi:hypothetical protein
LKTRIRRARCNKECNQNKLRSCAKIPSACLYEGARAEGIML